MQFYETPTPKDEEKPSEPIPAETEAQEMCIRDSNCIISDRAEIRVNIGCALVIVYTPKDMPAEPPQSEIQSRLPETCLLYTSRCV